MDQTDVLYFIAGACVMFAAMCAYVIYQHVQDERAQVYKYKFRKQIAHSEPLPDFDYVQKKERSPKSREASDVKAIKAAPLVVAKTTAPTPAAPAAPTPVIASPQTPVAPGPGISTSHDPPPVVFAAAAGGGVVAGAAVTAAAADPSPPPRAAAHNYSNGSNVNNINNYNRPAREPKAKKDRAQRIDDFDDYRKGSPNNLPPPGDAPAPASYTNPPEVKPKGSPRPQPGKAAQKDGLQF